MAGKSHASVVSVGTEGRKPPRDWWQPIIVADSIFFSQTFLFLDTHSSLLITIKQRKINQDFKCGHFNKKGWLLLFFPFTS
jgi:hypothetical protein